MAMTGVRISTNAKKREKRGHLFLQGLQEIYMKTMTPLAGEINTRLFSISNHRHLDWQVRAEISTCLLHVEGAPDWDGHNDNHNTSNKQSITQFDQFSGSPVSSINSLEFLPRGTKDDFDPQSASTSM